ncbi:hypothetical protein C8J56DRAFT_1052946 [Mycena floridula]|nr:hypothetical protein C8J56DRAFT_1052946 [Mycena floridula]
MRNPFKRKKKGEKPDAEAEKSRPGPNARAAVSALKQSLDSVAKLGLPGVGVAATGIRLAVENAQAQGQVKVDIEPLQQRMDRLWFYIKRAKEVQGDEPDNKIFEPLEKQLQKLRADIDTAVEQNKVAAFFNGTDDVVNFAAHGKAIDTHLIDIMFFIQTATKLNAAALALECDTAANIPTDRPLEGMINELDDNVIKEIQGKAFSSNEVGPGGLMHNKLSGNRIGRIGGDFMSGNKISSRTFSSNN